MPRLIVATLLLGTLATATLAQTTKPAPIPSLPDQSRARAMIRTLGGALFCNRRFDTVFTYHNGAESYYAGRGFRGSLRV